MNSAQLIHPIQHLSYTPHQTNPQSTEQLQKQTIDIRASSYGQSHVLNHPKVARNTTTGKNRLLIKFHCRCFTTKSYTTVTGPYCHLASCVSPTGHDIQQ